MTGRAFLRFISKHGIPLSCIANKLDCKLSTLRNLDHQETVPHYYIERFIEHYDEMLNEDEIKQLDS